MHASEIWMSPEVFGMILAVIHLAAFAVPTSLKKKEPTVSEVIYNVAKTLGKLQNVFFSEFLLPD